jgi:putative methionine-R-sulfoxide reductase with GAF domain
MHGSAQPDDRLESATGEEMSASPLGSVGESFIGATASGDGSHSSRVLADTELDSALQLLVERAQYITGATGTALALPQGDEMVCRASAGSSAPAVGARLQVQSGLTGESITRRQLLRCDNAEADPRVNLEACRALGIASIVVLPLLRKNGEVRGLFELFSDHPYAFEERDLIALERMAALTVTALDLAEQREKFAPAVVSLRDAAIEPGTTADSIPSPAAPSVLPRAPEVAEPAPLDPDISTESLNAAASAPLKATPDSPVNAEAAESAVSPMELPAISSSTAPATQVPATQVPVTGTPSSAAAAAQPSMMPPVVTPSESEPDDTAPAVVPEAMRRVQKCAACGFPVSEGRTLCLDCEKKDSAKKESEKKQREQEREKEANQVGQLTGTQAGPEQASDLAPAAGPPEEFIPAFLANAEPAKESWLADHVNLLAVIVLILGILVAVVVFLVPAR